MELKPGYYKTRGGHCAVVLSGRTSPDIWCGLVYTYCWRTMRWDSDAEECDDLIANYDLISTWPKDEPIPPGFPKIIFDEEPAQKKSTLDEEYWAKLAHTVAVDYTTIHYMDGPTAISRAVEFVKMLKERT